MVQWVGAPVGTLGTFRRPTGRGHFGVSGLMWNVVVCSASSLAVLCTVRFVGPNYKNQEGLAPDVVGGERCFGRSFVSFLGGQIWRGGMRPPVPGRCTGP